MNGIYIYNRTADNVEHHIFGENTYDLGEWLKKYGIEFVEIDNVYYVTVNGEITGEFYVVVGVKVAGKIYDVIYDDSV